MDPFWLWTALGGLVLFLLALDLGVFHRRAHAIELREALGWSAFWIALAAAFGVFVWAVLGPEAGTAYAAAYVLEKALSVDNLFVFAVVFGAMGVPDRYQHRVLFWGVLGALVFRGLFIWGGLALLDAFQPMTYALGALLVLTALRLFRSTPGAEADPERNPVVRLVRRVVPVTAGYRESRLWVREGGRWMATPLFVALVAVEVTDVLFAVDSVPAVLAVTQDPFVVYASNAFAILGLRALYFALSGVLRLFRHLHYGLAAVLAFVGLKLLLAPVLHVPVGVSLAVIGSVLGLTMVLSLLERKRMPATPAAPLPLSPARSPGLPQAPRPVRRRPLPPQRAAGLAP